MARVIAIRVAWTTPNVSTSKCEALPTEQAKAVSFDILFTGTNSQYAKGDARFARAILADPAQDLDDRSLTAGWRWGFGEVEGSYSWNAAFRPAGYDQYPRILRIAPSGRTEWLTLNAMKSAFAPNTLETVNLYNDVAKKRAYYGFPLKQQSMHVQIWGDMLEQAGFKPSDIPTKWEDYWSFWCDKVQPAYRKATSSRIYATGFPMGVDSSDSFYSFLTFMDAYNVKLVDDNGKLLVDDPKVKQGLVNALRDYTEPYTKGCTPPSSTSWKDPDNNVAFHNKTILMTHNATISIAAKWFDDMNNEKLSAAEREQAKKNYVTKTRQAIAKAQAAEADLLKERRGFCDLCASVQAAIVEVLVTKTVRAARRQGVRCVTASGGVTCNRALRAGLATACGRAGLTLRLAERSFCTDNAAMIGVVAERKHRLGKPPTSLDAEIMPGWRL